MDLAVNNALIVNAHRSFTGSVGCSNGTIALIGEKPVDADVVIDGTGKVLLPGVVDPHVHFKIAQGYGPDAVVGSDDYEIGPRAAAFGGVTTFIDFAIQKRGESALGMVEGRIAEAEAGSIVDFSFHAGLTDGSATTLAEIHRIMDLGVTSFKFFMTYRKWGFYIDRGSLAQAMALIAERSGVAAVHAEDDEILEFWRERLNAEDPSSMFNHSLSRPEFAEELAIRDAIELSREAGAQLYVVHLSTRRGLEVIEGARKRGVGVLTETCPHYLAFTHDVYRESGGQYFTMTPPLREPGNREELWRGVADGRIQLVSSDHNSFTRAQKDAATGFLDVPPGVYGTEMLLPYLLSEGVNAGRISLERAVAVTSTNAARIFSLPSKGAIEVGKDADLVLVDLERERDVSDQLLHDPNAYTNFAGKRMRGWPVMTVSRGEVIVDGDDCLARSGRGRFVARHPVGRAASAPMGVGVSP